MAEKAMDVLATVLKKYCQGELSQEEATGSLDRFFETVVRKTGETVGAGNTKPIGHLIKFLADCREAGLLDQEACNKQIADLEELQALAKEVDMTQLKGGTDKGPAMGA